MRIIAGEFRGRKLLPPKSLATRPILDRVKQSVFDVISPRIEAAVVYDCFAGTGSMGLEALSRGARQATFFEADRLAVAILRRNIDALAVGARSKVIAGDLFGQIRDAASAKVDLVFLDPPYRMLQDRAQDLLKLARDLAIGHLTPDGMVIFRHEVGDSLDLPPLRPIQQRKYGNMIVEFLTASNSC
jgi:16S rRNA (guanine966-N2)-methyltransferase